MVAIVPLRVRVLVMAVISAFATGTLAAQQEASSKPELAGKIVFKASVRRVIVDVVVTGADGKPVPSLRAADFTVAEDGKPQKILSFDVHDFEPVSDSLPKRPDLPVNTFINLPSGPERGPLYVLLLDLLNMEVNDQPAARKQILNFVLSKPLGTRFAIFVLSDGVHLVQGFTEDRNLLANALDPKSPRSHLPRVFLYADNFRPYYSIPRVLIGLAKYLGDFPGRKNIIWFSGSFPSTILPSEQGGGSAESFYKDIKEAIDAIARGQIAVYPIDSHGVVVTGASTGAFAHGNENPSAISGVGRSAVDSTKSSGTGGGAGNAADIALNARYMTEDELAYATGGRAFHSTNDLVSALTEATEAGGHYYTLTYAPSNQEYNGQQRNIHVDLAKRGCSLAYRRIYFGSPDFVEPGSSGKRNASEEMAAIQHEADSLNVHMQSGAPIVHQLLFRVHVRTLGHPAKATPEQMAKMAVLDAPSASSKGSKPRRPIEVQTYKIDYAIAAREKALEIAATAFGDDGKTLNGVVQRVEDDGSEFNDGQSHEGIYRIEQQIDVPTSAVSIRLGVRDLKTDNVGALEISLPLAPEGSTADASAHPATPAVQADDRLR
jgi:VWFA-related protein